MQFLRINQWPSALKLISHRKTIPEHNLMNVKVEHSLSAQTRNNELLQEKAKNLYKNETIWFNI